MNTIAEFVAKLHTTPGKGVILATGGGSEAVSLLCQDGGASNTLESFSFPYATKASAAFVGASAPVNAVTARRMAMKAYQLALETKDGDYDSFGIGVTSKLQKTAYDEVKGIMVQSERAGRMHEIHLAIHTPRWTTSWSVSLNEPTRRAEELINALMILDAVALAKETATVTHKRVLLDFAKDPRAEVWNRLKPHRKIETAEYSSIHPQIGEVMAGTRPYVRCIISDDQVCSYETVENTEDYLIVSGSFNPFHSGHAQMVEVGGKLTGKTVALEITVRNADKPPLDYIDIKNRLQSIIDSGVKYPQILITNAGTFAEKTAMFPNNTWAIGHDTAARINQKRFYGNHRGMIAAMSDMRKLRTKFLVFGRLDDTGVFQTGTSGIIDPFKMLCQVVPEDAFRLDISSTELRRKLNGGSHS